MDRYFIDPEGNLSRSLSIHKSAISHWDLLYDELVNTKASLGNDDKWCRWLRHISLNACFTAHFKFSLALC